MPETKWKDQQLYHLYIYMLKRCYCSTTPNFHRYGGRGITVCARWRMQKPKGRGFNNFKKDLGPRPPGYSLERLNNNGNYTPKNCEWVPRQQQYRNRCTNVWITYKGNRMIVKDWARKTGVREDIIMKRIRRGVPLKDALFIKRLPKPIPWKMIEAAAIKRRAQTHCHNGHPLLGDNLNFTSTGGRICRTCKRDGMRRRRGTDPLKYRRIRPPQHIALRK